MTGDHPPRPAPETASAFAALHRPGRPLVLPNAWDHASAAALVEAGFPAVGTTSLGVASAAGKPDGQADTRTETLRLARRLAALPVPVTVDVEGGFGTDPSDPGDASDPAEVADLVRELAGYGVAGVNLEDGRPDGSLRPVDQQCRLIVACREAAPGLFLNARTDTHWLPGHRAGTDRRLAAYQQAGADGLFVPGLRDPHTIERLAARHPLPLNILYAPGGPELPLLAALGVARVSTGSRLFRLAVHEAVRTARTVAGRPAPVAPPTYLQAQGWALAYR
ncbi:isocitrate lyase/phosphoenolpyruvate mutase family protein [Streptomyces sp. NPDC005438]|uniref:isocitrate lyase/PEP mutase family protein n=1 Tax=Streptomyces sp. NPDC005438 TaxID=3156880 RepID=UPI0033A6D449